MHENMTARHTPGPWTWTTDSAGPDDESGCATRGPIDVGSFKATGYCSNPELVGAHGEMVLSAGSGEYTPYHGATPEEAAANARLIASAPALLAALDSLVGILGNAEDGLSHDQIQAFDAAPAAMDAARGGEGGRDA